MRQAPYWKFHSGRHQTQSPASRAGLIQARSLNLTCVSFVIVHKWAPTVKNIIKIPLFRAVIQLASQCWWLWSFCGQGVWPASVLLCLFLLICFGWWFDFYFLLMILMIMIIFSVTIVRGRCRAGWWMSRSCLSTDRRVRWARMLSSPCCTNCILHKRNKTQIQIQIQIHYKHSMGRNATATQTTRTQSEQQYTDCRV